jgi:uncharacterized membrane protein
MEKMVVVVFDSEITANEGLNALGALQADDLLIVYAAALVARDSTGRVSVTRATGPDPLTGALGSATLALTGLLAATTGLGGASAPRALTDVLTDLLNVGVGADFLDETARALRSARGAVVADVDETWVIPLDMRMETMGSSVFRCVRTDIAHFQIERELAAERAELESLIAEHARAVGPTTRARLQKKIEAARGKLLVTAGRIGDRVETLKHETEARIASLDARAARASGQARIRLEQRRAELVAEYRQRTSTLDRAWKLMREALAA